MTDEGTTQTTETGDPLFWRYWLPVAALVGIAFGIWLFTVNATPKAQPTPWPTITIGPATVTPTVTDTPGPRPPSTNIPPHTATPTSTATATASPSPPLPEETPAATPTIDACAGVQGDFYTIQPGDTLWSIAGNCLGDPYRWVEIAELNGLANPDLIHAGNGLIMPRGRP